MNNFIEINDLKKKFNLLDDNELLIFENLNFSITKNSINSIVGPSGCGKSTLLNILGLLDSNFEGQFLFEGKATQSMSSNQLSSIRNKKIGFIHQFFNLIPELSVLENIILPGLINNNKESTVSIALINKPDLILADEMTGNLDEDTSDEIINFFLKFIQNNNISLLYVTHNQKYADMANNKYEFKNKKLILK